MVSAHHLPPFSSRSALVLPLLDADACAVARRRCPHRGRSARRGREHLNRAGEPRGLPHHGRCRAPPSARLRPRPRVLTGVQRTPFVPPERLPRRPRQRRGVQRRPASASERTPAGARILCLHPVQGVVNRCGGGSSAVADGHPPPSPAQLCVRLDAGCRVPAVSPGPAGGSRERPPPLRAAARARRRRTASCRSRRAAGRRRQSRGRPSRTRRRPRVARTVKPQRYPLNTQYSLSISIPSGEKVFRKKASASSNVTSQATG